MQLAKRYVFIEYDGKKAIKTKEQRRDDSKTLSGSKLMRRERMNLAPFPRCMGPGRRNYLLFNKLASAADWRRVSVALKRPIVSCHCDVYKAPVPTHAHTHMHKQPPCAPPFHLFAWNSSSFDLAFKGSGGLIDALG